MGLRWLYGSGWRDLTRGNRKSGSNKIHRGDLATKGEKWRGDGTLFFFSSLSFFFLSRLPTLRTWVMSGVGGGRGPWPKRSFTPRKSYRHEYAWFKIQEEYEDSQDQRDFFFLAMTKRNIVISFFENARNTFLSVIFTRKFKKKRTSSSREKRNYFYRDRWDFIIPRNDLIITSSWFKELRAPVVFAISLHNVVARGGRWSTFESIIYAVTSNQNHRFSVTRPVFHEPRILLKKKKK